MQGYLSRPENVVSGFVVEDLIAGRYQIVEDLGDSKKAIDRLTGLEVVVRSKSLDAPPPGELLERLIRLRHPNLAAFIHHFPHHGELLMITECLSGSSLESLLNDSRPIDAAQAKTWLLAMAAGTQAVHSARLLVGDLSPSKIIVGENRTIKLVDPGLAGLIADRTSIQTEVSVLAAIYRRMLGQAAGENPLLLDKLDAAQTCSGILAAFKEADLVTPGKNGPTPDAHAAPIPSKRFLFQNWNRRHVIAVIATLVGIFLGYKIATYGQSASLLNRWMGH